MKHKLFIPLTLLGLSITWQPLVAHEQDLQATVQKMQIQLEQQQKELAEQRILIQQLLGSQPAATTGPHTPAVAKPTDDSTVVAQQPGTDTPPAKADQSGQQQAVEALAQQQQMKLIGVRVKTLGHITRQLDCFRSFYSDPIHLFILL